MPRASSNQSSAGPGGVGCGRGRPRSRGTPARTADLRIRILDGPQPSTGRRCPRTPAGRWQLARVAGLGVLLLAAALQAQQASGIAVTWPEGLEGLRLPVEIALPEGARLPRGALRFAEGPVQRLPGAGERLLALLPAGKGTRRYLFRATEAAESRTAHPLRVVERPAAGLDVLGRRGVLLTWVSSPRLAPGVAQRLRRSTYIHPLRNLEGIDVLDDFPKDHPHHRGISWMWPRVTLGGKTHDLWHLRGIGLRFEKLLGSSSGPAGAWLSVRNGWYCGGRRAVCERVDLTVVPLWRSGTPLGHVLDLAFTWEAVAGPVTLGGQLNEGKGYGGVGMRLAPRVAARITTSAGAVPGDSLHRRLAWADYSARFRGARDVSGVALMPHPGNPGHPNEWILRQYGYIGECWPGVGTVTLCSGRPIRARYRVFVHVGSAAEADVARVAAAWARPPRASLLLP